MKMYRRRYKNIMYVLSMVVLLSSMVVLTKQGQQVSQDKDICGIIDIIEPDSVGGPVKF